MRVSYYCQHVLGVGHVHRSREICRALARNHAVTMIIGGAEIGGRDPELTYLQLPGLQMDASFSQLMPCEPGAQLEQVKTVRREMLLAHARQPLDCLIIELYPFGRKAFRFELEPLLAMVQQTQPSCRIYCSLRDILVEKEQGQDKHEQRAVDTLNAHFHGLLVHADPNLISLEQTFGRLDQVQVPIHYTGFVTPEPAAAAAASIRAACGLARDQQLVVASIGSGSVGTELLIAVAETLPLLQQQNSWFLQIFTGPYCNDSVYQQLLRYQNDNLRVQRFTDRFIDWLAAADLSVSMAGYNTCMNVLAAGVPALLYPFGQNREQRLRVEKLGAAGEIALLDNAELSPPLLAARIEAGARLGRYRARLDLDGARRTAAIIEAGGAP